MKKIFKSVVIAILVLVMAKVVLFLGIAGLYALVSAGWEQYITTDVADYGNYVGNIDNKRVERFITYFFPEQIEDYFSEVQYSYRAEEGDTCAFEAYLEFVIEDVEQYETFVAEYTSEVKGEAFSYNPEFTEYVYCDQFAITSYCKEEKKDNRDVSIDSAGIAKILCDDEEQRIIFVALGVVDGGGTDTEFLTIYFDRFNIDPWGYERDYVAPNVQIKLC